MKAFQIISPLHTALKEIDAPACRAGEVLLRIRYVGSAVPISIPTWDGIRWYGCLSSPATKWALR